MMRIAVVGIGKVARDNYLPVLAARPEVELGYFSRSGASVRAAIAEHGGRAFEDWGEVRAWGPEVIFVTAADVAHAEMLRAALAAGAPRIFMEKPLVAQRGQARVTDADFHLAAELIGHAHDRGAEVAIGFNYRFFDTVRHADGLSRSGELGAPISAVASSHFACWSHIIDLLGHFLGPIEAVSALASREERSGAGLTARDLSVSFRTSGGAGGVLHGTAQRSWRHPLFSLGLGFERGSLELSDLDGELVIRREEAESSEQHRLVADVSRWQRYSASFARSITAYLDAVQAGLPAPVPAEAGLCELQFEAGIARSLAEGRLVVLDEEFPLHRP